MNPIQLSYEIEARYQEYLKTTFYFRDPVLRRPFQEALASGRIRKGPYLEGTPVFVSGAKTSSVFQELLQKRADSGFLAAIHGDRSLYSHQEAALRRASAGGNVVVATGTGSGKTESFLFPILTELYRQFLRNEVDVGVRAIVLYPMNALANDQRERLGQIACELVRYRSPFAFTYGQYTGETPENNRDSYRSGDSHASQRRHGELVFREEMRDSPPHILLTNYSMLEYLLLRPQDSPFFDEGRGRTWRFIVLDEAHQYRGAKGIEMAMLLRRLKYRLTEGGHQGSFQCLATSATLMGGEDDRGPVAKFAADLFGEPFDASGVILGQIRSMPSRPDHYLDPAAYKNILSGLDNTQDQCGAISNAAERMGIAIPADEPVRRSLGRLLARDARAHDLRQRIASPTAVEKLIEDFFGSVTPDSTEALTSLVELLAQAEDLETGTALLAPRYHLFLKSLEGAFLSVGDSPRISLDRTNSEGGVVFEIALCRECGQHYLAGKLENHYLVEGMRDTGDEGFSISFFRPIEMAEITDQPTYTLCGHCGEIRPSPQPLHCSHARQIRVVKEKQSEAQEDQLSTCGACGHRGRDPVREVVHGTDGPHAVIATTIHANLAPSSRKLLAFADGRQNAAFFAWYLDESYRDIQIRNLLLRVARRLQRRSGEEPTLRDLASELEKEFRSRRLVSQTASRVEVTRRAWTAVFREFLTDERRISLEGVALLRWTLHLPDDCEVGRLFMDDPWNLSAAEAHHVTVFLLDTFRVDRAVELKTGDNDDVTWPDIGLDATQMSFCIGPPQGQQAHSWDGEQTRRVKFLTRLLGIRGVHGQDAVTQVLAVLRTFWEVIKEWDRQTIADDRILLTTNHGRRANPGWWRAAALLPTDSVYQCDICGRVQSLCIGRLCARHRCTGNLISKRVADLESNHYRTLYESDLPSELRVEEHTAQLGKDKAREFQRDFKEGRIHVLSCSTTFELGVDLGDLDTVFLRNVPPESFNYAQRVGRAGRRQAHTGFAITYCRRTPHDLSHFAEPERMLAGRVKPPVLSIGNEKIVGRHLAATALSYFFRCYKERFQSVQRLLGDLAAPSGVTALHDFLLQHRSDLETAFRNILPSNLCERLLANGAWMSTIALPMNGKHNGQSRFAQAEAEVSEDYRRLTALELKAAVDKQYSTARWAQLRIQTIASENTLSFLSRKAVIPKYGFPVDVVELDTQPINRTESAEVLLQRDLAIAIGEFAPTSKIIANKREWASYALKRVAEREWPRRHYQKCSKHNMFVQWEAGQDPPGPFCCGRGQAFEYLIPQFGFSTERKPPKAPKARTARPFTTRPYFVRSLLSTPTEIAVPAHLPILKMTEASPGVMVVLCEGKKGQGFLICNRCGAGFRERPRTHDTAYGQPCKGTLSRVSLGHEFTTDVLKLQFQRSAPVGEDAGWFALALAAALVEGAAEVLETAPTDISSTVAPTADVLPVIVLYDNVPGGAGLVARLQDEAMVYAVLLSARSRVVGRCGCGEETSCYGCLRSYRNQFAHHRLKRGPVLAYLEEIVRRNGLGVVSSE